MMMLMHIQVNQITVTFATSASTRTSLCDLFRFWSALTKPTASFHIESVLFKFSVLDTSLQSIVGQYSSSSECSYLNSGHSFGAALV